MHTLTLMPYANAYIRGRSDRAEITDQTAEGFRYTLIGLAASFGRRPLNQYGPAAIDRWLATISHLSPATRRQYLSRVRMFSRWLAAEGRIKVDPTLHVPAIRQPRTVVVTFTGSESSRLFAAISGDVRATAMAEVLFGCGARCVEVSRLHVEDYDPHGLTLRLTGKGMHERMVPVPPSTAVALDAYLDAVGRQSGPLFRSELHPTSPLSPRTISAYFRRWARLAGVKARAHDGRSAHGARRSCGADVAESAGILAASAVLGHARIETTARAYSRPVPMATMRAAMDARTYRGAA